MTAATVCLSSTSRVSTMEAAILITGGCLTFARCVSAFFRRLCVIHFSFSFLILIFVDLSMSLLSENVRRVLSENVR